MKYCSKCNSWYEDSLKRCPRDGELLTAEAGEPPPGGTVILGEGSEGAVDNTAQLAREINELFFKVCSSCKRAYGGDVAVCPHDGSQLAEQSLMARDTMLYDSDGLTALALGLKKYCPSCNAHFPLTESVCKKCGAPLEIPTLGGASQRPENAAELSAVIAGKYKLLEDIGAGGFGSVYLAKHESLGKRYAVKVLRQKFSDSTEFRSRFHEEALKLSRVEDENIVRVIDFGEWDGSQYMVTEYIEGQELSSIIYSEKASVLRAARIMQQVASALSEAHAKNIVHLDLKPGNILVSQKRGRDIVKVIDFGLAEMYSETRAGRQQNIAGTCSYMAPEQWKGEAVDPRTDIYAFGIIFYEFLAGRPPFREKTVSALEKSHCEKRPASIRRLRPDTPPELAKLIHRCLAKDPAKRCPSASELESALDSYVRRTENVVGRWLVRAAAGIVGLVLVAAAAWLIWDTQVDKEKPICKRFTVGRLSEDGIVVGDSNSAYRTREAAVMLTVEATDDEGVDHFILQSRALGDEPQVVPAEKLAVRGRLLWRASADLSLEAGTNEVRVWAHDGRNQSDEALVTIKRLAEPSCEIREEGLPAYTKEDEVELVFDRLEGLAVQIVCRNSAYDVEVKKDSDGNYGSSKTGDPSTWQALPGPPPRLEVPLEPGKNEIEVWARDLMVGDKQLINTLGPIDVRRDALTVTARLDTSQPTVRERGSDRKYLSGTKNVELVVTVSEAKRRLRPGTTISYRLNKEATPRTPTWTSSELRIAVILPKDGPNIVTIDPITDRYDITSKPIILAVELDSTPPGLTILNTASELTYYGGKLPEITFTCSDAHLSRGAEAFSVTRLADDQSIPGRFTRGHNGTWKLRFLDPATIPRDGLPEFRIRAEDDLGNKTGDAEGCFMIRADHTPPRVEIQSPAERETFGEAQCKTIVVRIKAIDGDAFRDALTVGGVVTPDGTEPTPFTLKPMGMDIWEGTINLEKPRRFDTLAPGFTATITATDGANQTTPVSRRFRFTWEDGDQLTWRDGSVLVYHSACPHFHVQREFFMATTEVSNRQFLEFLLDQGGRYDFTKGYWDPAARRVLKGFSCPRSEDWPEGKCRRDRLDWPIRKVSWYEAAAYAAWAGLKVAGRDEWLAAAFWDYESGLVERHFPWRPFGGGRSVVPIRAAGDNVTNPVPVTAAGRPYAAGRTPFGLAHMLGNVWELAQDRATGRTVQLGGSFTTGRAVFKARDKDLRDWLCGSRSVASTLDKSDVASDRGFRCMLLLPAPPATQASSTPASLKPPPRLPPGGWEAARHHLLISTLFAQLSRLKPLME